MFFHVATFRIFRCDNLFANIVVLEANVPTGMTSSDAIDLAQSLQLPGKPVLNAVKRLTNMVSPACAHVGDFLGGEGGPA